MINFRFLFLLAIMMPFAYVVTDVPVKLSISGMNTTMENGLLSVSFKEDGSAARIEKDGINLVTQLSGAERDPSKKRSAYLDYYVKGVKDFIPDHVSVIKNDKNIAHVAYVDERNGLLRLEYHLIMRRGVSGIYSYVVAENKSRENIKVSELRNVYRFNPQLLDHLFSGERQGRSPLYGELEKMPKIQDETWRLPDNSIYTKYDFAGYQRGNPFWGVYGNQIGAWLIHASGEYFSGDALKQDLLVHQDAIILNYMTGAHMGTPDMIAPPGWKKLYGPWLLYINQGDTQKILADANSRSEAERASWPYRWMDDKRYVQNRTNVLGQVNTSTAVTVVLSSSPDEEFDVQTLGNLFYANSDRAGRFQISNVIPGNYQLSVYANGGNQAGILARQKITIEGKEQKIGPITLPAPVPVIWAIGEANRQAREFRFGKEERNYRWQHAVPARLTFDIGQSDYTNDWYYAQTKPGVWDIRFNMKPSKPIYWLNIALAAASNNGMQSINSPPALTIKVNNTALKTLKYENDKTLYRSAMRNGRYHVESIPVDAALLRSGDNTVSLELNGGSVMYDIITLTE